MLKFLFMFLLPTLSVAQIMPYEDLFFWNKEDILANKIASIDAYEHEVKSDTIIADSNITKGVHQLTELYDSLGRIISKTNYYLYSDLGSKKRELGYDSSNKVITYQLSEKGSLVRNEKYSWQNGLLKEWELSLFMGDELSVFSKSITYDSQLVARKELLIAGKKVLKRDTIIYVYDSAFTAVVRKDLRTKTQIDSVVSFKTGADTLFKKAVYEAGVLVYQESQWLQGNDLTQRVVEYQEGIFHHVYYRMSIRGRISYEKQIHVVPTLNFDKLYFYDHNGVPVRKEVYRNSKTPSSMVFYKINLTSSL